MPTATKTHSTSFLATHADMATAALSAELDYRAALSGLPDDTDEQCQALDAAATRRSAACLALARRPATSLAELQAKARVLMDGVCHSSTRLPVLHDGEGLAWSLLQDLAALRVVAG